MSVDQQRPGTLVELALDSEVQAEAVMDTFSKLAGGLVVFARQLRQIEIRDTSDKTIRNVIWAPEIICEQDGYRIEQADFFSPSDNGERVPAIYFRCGYGGLLLGFGPRGFKKLPQEMPAIWVVAPTKEGTNFGIAVNGAFDLDAGRAKLSGTSNANSPKAKAIGRMLTDGFCVLHDEAKKDWASFTKRVRLEEGLTFYDFWKSFWDVLTATISGSDNPARQLVRHILTADCGIGAFISTSDRVALPTGLWGAYATLTNPSQVRYVLRDLLNTEKNFSIIAKMSAFAAKALPGQVISKDIHAALCKILPEWGQKRNQWISLQAQDVVNWVVGDGKEVTPEMAKELGSLIDREFEKQDDDKQEEVKALFKHLRETLTFQTENDQWKKAGELLVRVDSSQKEFEEESLRAGFAPAQRLLSRKYSGKAVEFFRICRERMQAIVEDMEAWIREADDDKRCAAILYLRDGDERAKLLGRLRNGGIQETWIATLNKNSPYFDDWDDHDRDELLLRGLKSLEELKEARPAVPEDEEEIPAKHFYDPRLVLPAIYDWWQRESEIYLPRYEQRVYPDGCLPQLVIDDAGEFDRSAWLTLLLLGTFHTKGRTMAEQHRGFINLCQQNGWWRVFFTADSANRPDKWMEVLDQFFDQQNDIAEYAHWFKEFPSIYCLSRHLDEYVEIFSSVKRHLQAGTNLQAVLTPRAGAVFQGGGIDAPPITKILGMGVCFVLRELARSGLVDHPEVSSYCYPPTSRLRKLFSQLGVDIDENAFRFEQSQAIYKFLVEHLGSEKATFMGHFDIPLQVVADDPDVQRKVGITVESVWEDACDLPGIDGEAITRIIENLQSKGLL
jgi:hypothetical protein